MFKGNNKINLIVNIIKKLGRRKSSIFSNAGSL